MANPVSFLDPTRRKPVRESRRVARKKVLVHATLSIGKSGSQSFPCILKDVSTTGCQVVGSAVDLVSDVFILRAEIFKEPQRCVVAWRTKRAIGAFFRPIDPPRAVEPVPPAE